MKICSMTLDSKGRITIPKSFLEANNLTGPGWVIYLEDAWSDSYNLKLTFDNKMKVNRLGLGL